MKTIGDSLPRRFKAKASGAITAGKPLIVEADGDVTQIAETAFAQLTGTESTFESAETNYTASCYDSTANKFVIAYQDQGNSQYGTAVVCTPAANGTMSFGTPVVFSSGSAFYIATTYDSNADKTLISYRRGSAGKSIVGTVSGTSISFGSSADFESAAAYYNASCFDSTNNKVVIAYRDQGDSNKGKAVVATISGTSVSFGTPVQFESGATSHIACEYDSANEKVLIAYEDEGNSSYGTAIVGTVSGTSISFGTAAVFLSSAIMQSMGICYSTVASKFVIAYPNDGDSGNGETRVATVSGTSVSFGTSVDFSTGSLGQTQVIALTYDVGADKINYFYSDSDDSNNGIVRQATLTGTDLGSFSTAAKWESSGSAIYISASYDTTLNISLVTYKNGANSNYGTANLVRPVAFNISNLTSENYIGIAEYAASDTETATVLIKGGVSTTQSSLTPGQTYFVQGDGTIGTSAGSPSVTAGTAVTSTKLIVKG